MDTGGHSLSREEGCASIPSAQGLHVLLFFSPGKSKLLGFLTREYNILNSALIQEKKGRKKREEIERWMGERENTQAYQTKWNMARACHLLFKGSREMPHVFLSLPCLLSPNSPSFLAFQKEMTTRMCH